MTIKRKYAVVDIETTGSRTTQHGITEVAVYVYDGDQIIDEFSSLVNPGTPIPDFITALTGIDNEMVATAPSFTEIAQELLAILQGCVFVAHNVNFDYGFIKQEMDIAGLKLNLPKLCSARVSRKVFPKLPSYSLGNLCEHFGIENGARHRAGGDARATVDLLTLILEKDISGHVEQALKRGSKEAILPPNLDIKAYHRLPTATGIYYFHDQSGKVIYVGMAGNILKRINGHFSSGSKSKTNQALFNSIHDISHEILGDDMVAALVENAEIKRLWPQYNQALKRQTKRYGLYQFTGQDGYIRLQVSPVAKGFEPVLVYTSEAEGRYDLKRICTESSLCPKLCGLQKTQAACYDHDTGKCQGACIGQVTAESYNQQAHQAITQSSGQQGSFLILGKGRENTEASIVWIDEGKYMGYGFVPKSEQIEHPEAFLPFIKPTQDETDARRLVASYLRRGGKRTIVEIPARS